MWREVEMAIVGRERALAEVVRRKARGHAAPVHGEAADAHRARLHPVGCKAVDVVPGPGALAVVHVAPAQRREVARPRLLRTGLHDHDLRVALVGQLLRDHGRRDAGADHADVALHHPSGHAGPPASGRGSRDAVASGRHSPFRICAR